MEENNHKGTELNNVKETWDQNERERTNSNNAGSDAVTAETALLTELDQIIRQEANEYDNTNKEDRILGGDRATVSDDENG